MKKMTSREYFLMGVAEVKKLGYKCFQPIGVNNDITFCKITDGVNIGYMQLGQWRDSFNFGTVSKYGSQFRIMNPNEKNKYFQYEFNIEDITKEAVELSFRIYPNWEYYGKEEKIIKYKDWEDYITNSLDAKIYKGFVEI